jgi:hypothetical protein
VTYTGFIYALAGTDGIRYVGKTEQTAARPRQSLARRYNQHRYSARGGAIRVYKWWRSQSAEPRMIVLEVCDAADVAERECAWIRFYRLAGARLTNHTEGGEGAPGYVHTPETRAKMSAAQRGRVYAPLSPETRAKISAAHKGKPLSAEHRAAMTGHTTSAETRAKMSAERLRRSEDPAYLAKLSAAHKGEKHTPEHVAKMRAAMTGHTTSAETRAKMSAALTGKTLSAEHRASLSAGQRRRCEDPAERAKMSERTRLRFEDPAERAKVGAASRGRIASAEARAHMSAAQKAAHAANPRPPASHCKRGHEFTPENTGTDYRGRRYCLACALGGQRAYRAANAEHIRERERARYAAKRAREGACV